MEKQELKKLIYEDIFIGDLLQNNEAKLVLEKFFPTIFSRENMNPPSFQWATLRQLRVIPEANLSENLRESLVEELAEIESLVSLADKAVKRIPLWESQNLDNNGFNSGCPSIQPFLLEGEGPHPVMIVAPGGAYFFRAGHEGYPVAHWLNSIGISAIVLHYRVAPYKHPVPLGDIQRAIRFVRYRATEWNVDPNRVGILGFSAGGHLVSTAGTHFDLGDQHSEDPIERYSSRPDLMVLCYPVISMGEHTHEFSGLNLLGEHPSEEMVTLLSNELQITDNTPPAFLRHTADDEAVDVENSMLFATQLSRHKVPFDLHIFESGHHGLGLAEGHPEANAWPSLCEAWLRKRGF